jgi:hypothetical protein
MRTQLWALFSALGLAGSSAPASAQALKGSTAADTKTESTIKARKIAHEDAASKDAAKMTKAALERKRAGETADDKRKLTVSSVEGGHATSDVVSEKQLKTGRENTFEKSVKSSGETHALTTASQDKWRKVASEKSAAAAESGFKPRKSGDRSTARYKKTVGESNAVSKENWIKGSKATADANSVQNEAAKKGNPAQPK